MTGEDLVFLLLFEFSIVVFCLLACCEVKWCALEQHLGLIKLHDCVCLSVCYWILGLIVEFIIVQYPNLREDLLKLFSNYWILGLIIELIVVECPNLKRETAQIVLKLLNIGSNFCGSPNLGGDYQNYFQIMWRLLI